MAALTRAGGARLRGLVGGDAPDSELFARAADRQESAIDALFTRYGAKAYGLALALVRDTALAQDVVAAAFAALWHDTGDTGGGDRAARLLADVHRRAADLVRSGRSAADVAVLPAEFSERFAHLPPEDLEALGLAYFRCHTIQDIAVALGLSTEEAARRVHRALGRLAQSRVPHGRGLGARPSGG